jgi:beta-lactam-binding protein with PASTA domain
LRIVPGAGTEAGWFKVRDGDERDVGPGKMEDFSIDLSVPGAEASRDIPPEQRPRLSFHGAAVNLKNPDNDVEPGSAVAFQAPALTQASPFKWWMVAAPVALILLVVGAFFGIRAIIGNGGDLVLADWTNKTVEEARSALTKQELQVSEQHPSQLQPAVGAQGFYDRIVESQNPASDGTLPIEAGSEVTLVWEWRPKPVTVPDLNGQTLPNAIPLLEQNGLRYVAAQDPPQPQPANSYPVVRSWSPSGTQPAGTGITLTMGWQERRRLDFTDVAIQLQRFKEVQSAASPRHLEPELAPQ